MCLAFNGLKSNVSAPSVIVSAASGGYVEGVFKLTLFQDITLVTGTTFEGYPFTPLTFCLNIESKSNKSICAKYNGIVSQAGVQADVCSIYTGDGVCDCTVCPDKESVKFDCAGAGGNANLTSKDVCVNLAVVDKL